MANEQEMQVSAEPTIYFYVNTETDMVDFVSMYNLFGIVVHPKGEKWTAAGRSDLDPYYSEKYDIWAYDWDNEDDTPGSGDFDPDNEAEWEIEPVQRWARGEDLTKADVEAFARLVVSGSESFMRADEAESIPGE